MDIPNLSQEPIINQPKPKLITLPVVLIIVVLGLITGFVFTRIFPKNNQGSTTLTSGKSQP